MTENKGDLISREALKKALEITQYNDIDDLTRTERLIDNAPTVHHPNCDNCEDKAKQYTLGFQDGYDYGYNFKYSACDKKVIDKTNFCPECGATMQNGDKEE